LEQRIHVALQDFSLALNSVANGFHDEKQKKRDGDQNDDNGQSHLVSEEIP